MNNKIKRTDHKKLLVRNTSSNPSKTSITTKKSDPVKTGRSTFTVSSNKKPSQSTKPPSGNPTNSEPIFNFETPELNSALRIAKKIEVVENIKPRKGKSVTALESNKLAVDEKVTKFMNFPYDQPIYKDLIPICAKDTITPTPVSSRHPLPQKDKEPVLSDYCEPRKCREYSYVPKVRYEREQLLPIKNNNLRLYKILQISHNKT